MRGQNIHTKCKNLVSGMTVIFSACMGKSWKAFILCQCLVLMWCKLLRLVLVEIIWRVFFFRAQGQSSPPLCSSLALSYLFGSVLLCPWGECTAFNCLLSLHVQLSSGKRALIVPGCKDIAYSQQRVFRSRLAMLTCLGSVLINICVSSMDGKLYGHPA